MYKTPLADAEEGAAWIEKAVVEKFYRSGMFMPFEVVRRHSFLQDFDKASPVLRNAMCALAATLAVPRAPVSVMRHYYEDSRRLLLENFDEPSLETWQATLVLINGKIAPAFMLVGMAARLMSLFQVDQGNNNNNSIYMSMTEIEREICRRCYWTTFSFDRLISLFTGRPVQLQSFNANLEAIPRMPDEQWFGVAPEEATSASDPIPPPAALGAFPLALFGPDNPPPAVPPRVMEAHMPPWPFPVTEGFDGSRLGVPPDTGGFGGGAGGPGMERMTGAGGMPHSSMHPHIIFASRILGILHDISKAYDELEGTNGNANAPDSYQEPMFKGSAARGQNPKALKWRREMMLEKRLEEWEDALPPGFRITNAMINVLRKGEPLDALKLMIEDVKEDQLVTHPGRIETENDFVNSWEKGFGSRTVMRLVMYITSRCCLLQLHRPRLHARRIWSMEERDGCTKPQQIGEKPFDPLGHFDPPTSRRLDRSLQICADASITILGIFKAVATISIPEAYRSPRAAKLRRELNEFEPLRGTPISGFATTLASICLVECCVAIGWVLVLEAVEGRPGRTISGRDWGRWRGFWTRSDAMLDRADRVRLQQTAVKGLEMALWLMADLSLIRGVKTDSVSPEVLEGGTASSRNASTSAASNGRSGAPRERLGNDNPASALFRVDERWADAMRELVNRYQGRVGGLKVEDSGMDTSDSDQDLSGWDLRTDKEVEEEIAFLEKMEMMLEEHGVLRRIPFNGLMESFL
ncbi:hypothetical protein HDU96_005231 [Phlyctochytrium bullatum]|nr:hypothetical protein HDU96_005231 [Phlyctochytrium bullatum]